MKPKQNLLSDSWLFSQNKEFISTKLSNFLYLLWGKEGGSKWEKIYFLGGCAVILFIYFDYYSFCQDSFVLLIIYKFNDIRSMHYYFICFVWTKIFLWIITSLGLVRDHLWWKLFGHSIGLKWSISGSLSISISSRTFFPPRLSSMKQYYKSKNRHKFFVILSRIPWHQKNLKKYHALYKLSGSPQHYTLVMLLLIYNMHQLMRKVTFQGLKTS